MDMREFSHLSQVIIGNDIIFFIPRGVDTFDYFMNSIEVDGVIGERQMYSQPILAPKQDVCCSYTTKDHHMCMNSPYSMVHDFEPDLDYFVETGQVRQFGPTGALLIDDITGDIEEE